MKSQAGIISPTNQFKKINNNNNLPQDNNTLVKGTGSNQIGLMPMQSFN